jgi:hypothetical protein
MACYQQSLGSFAGVSDLFNLERNTKWKGVE